MKEKTFAGFKLGDLSARWTQLNSCKERNMKEVIVRCVLVSIVVLASFELGFSQTVTFYDDGFNSDRPVLIHAKIGKRSSNEYITLKNKSSNKIKVKIHTHSDLHFVHFIDDYDDSGHEITITLGVNSSYRLKCFVHLTSGNSKVYNDELGLDVSFYNRAGRRVKDEYFEIGFAAYLYKYGSSSMKFTRPSGYDAIMRGNLPARWKISDLPLKVYSNHRSYGFTNYDNVLQKAINTWNVAGRSVGLNVDFFKLTSSYGAATIHIDWSGRLVPPGAMGVAQPSSMRVGMLPLKNYQNLGAAGETLCQELCHLLGVLHSSYPNDMMNGTAHGHWHNLSEIALTSRDRQMLGWLYSRRRFHAF